MRDSRFAWICVSLALGTPAAALADGDRGAEEIVRERRDQDRDRSRLDAAAEAGLFSPLVPERRVAYAQVLEHPDDAELNFRWAQTQLQDGNATGAAATLQRILLNQPDLPRVRMFYAVVLMRLGTFAEAERELDRLERERGTTALGPEIRRYRDQVRQAQRRTRHSLSLLAGTQYDSNRNSGPDSNQVLISDTRVTLGAAGKKSADGGWFSLAEWQMEHDLGHHEDRQLVTSLTYIHSQQADLDSFDVQAMRLGVGLRGRREGKLWHPRLIADVIDLSREVYLRTAGLELELNTPLGQRLSLSATGSILHEDFDGIPEAPTAAERSGFRSRLEAVLAYGVGPRQRIDLTAALTRKSARKSYHAYTGFELGLGHVWDLQGLAFLSTSVSVQNDLYVRNQDSVSRSKRRDLRTRARASLGIPLGRLTGLRVLEDLSLGVTGEVALTDSNLPNYELKNRKLSVTLSKRLDF